MENPNYRGTEREHDGWFYESKGKRIGPVSYEIIKSLVVNNEINSDSLIWKKGFNDWKKVKETEFKDLIELPPPLKGDKVNNSIIWILAFAPLIGFLIEVLLLENGYNFGENGPWWLYLILNSGFAILDDSKLKNAGYTTNNLVWAIFLIPVYLWRRATITKQSKAYFWVWLILFVSTTYLLMSYYYNVIPAF